MPPEMNSSTWDVEFRAASGDSGDTEANDGRNFTGYAAVFDQPTQIRGWEGAFTERMAKGAFKKTLRESTPVMQFDHGRDSRVGSCPIGHYTDIREDDNGLAVKARLFDNPVVEPVRQAIEAKSVRGMSIKFNVTKERWRDAAGKLVKPEELGQLLYEPGERGPLDREIREVRLMEAGPVVHPAYTQTTAAVRSADERSERIDNLAANYSDTFEDEERDEVAEVTETVAEERENAEEVEEISNEEREKTSETEEVEDAQKVPARADQGDTDAKRAKSPEHTKSAQTQRKAEVKMPKTIDELIARQAEIEARLMEMGQDAESRDLSDDENTEFDALTDERDALIKSQERITKRMDVLKSLASSGSSERGSDKGAPAFHKKQDDIYDLGELRSMAYNGDDFLAKVTDNAKRAIEAASYGVKGKEGAQERASELLEDVDTESRDLAKRYLLTGSEAYTRAFGKIMKNGSDAMCTNEERQALIRAQGLSTNSGADGGYAVPFQLDPTVILTNAGTVNPIRQLARVETIVGKQWQGVTSAGTTVTRGAENATAPDSSFSIAQPVVSTNRVQGFVPFSIEIELSWSALQREITNVLVDAKAREEDSFITGDGTGVNPEGIVGVATSDFTTAATPTFTLADLYNFVASLPVRWEENASFLAHKAIYNLIRQFDTAGGAALWAHLGDGTPARLLDFPTFRTSAMASTLASTNKIAMFGDFKQMLIVDRIGMSVELVPHIFDSANGNRPTGQRGVYAVWMNNSKVLVPTAFKRLKVL